MKITKKFISNIFVFVPHMLMYILLVYLSMDTADDRSEYIKFFENPYASTRFEYLYVKVAEVFYFLEFNSYTSILIIQFITIFTFYLIFYNSIQKKKLLILTLTSFFLFSIMSNPLGIQIRFGFAVSILLLLYFKIYKKNFSYSVLYLVPALLHYGTIPFILFALISRIKSKISPKSIVLFIFLGSFSISMFVKIIITLFNFNEYYLGYFTGLAAEQRVISFTLLYYLIISFCNYRCSTKFSKTYWLQYVGVVFGICSIAADLTILLKMMLPFVVLSTIDLFNNISKLKLNDKTLFPFFYISSFLSFLYYVLMVKI